MNERIKELYNEAVLYTMDNAGRKGQASSNIMCAEKFAELIVKECGVALSPMLRDMVSRGQAYDLIKQHFGVTE